ncbi:MAG: thioesterase family protein [Burkholderiaceae bacterium]
MRFDLPDGLKLVHEMRIPVRWGDLDAMGHVNNTIYFRYFETLRIEWLTTVNALPNPEGVGPVMANGFCNFIRQIEFPGDIVARHYVTPPREGAKSLDTYFTLAIADAPEVVSANGGATLVWLDFPNKKTVALPDDLRAACS